MRPESGSREPPARSPSARTEVTIGGKPRARAAISGHAPVALVESAAMRILPASRRGRSAPTPRNRHRKRLLRQLAKLCCAGLVVATSSIGSHVFADAEDSVVASFTGGAITRTDLETVINQRLPVQKDLLSRPGAVEQVLESLVRYDLLVQEAEKRGYRNQLVVQLAAQAKANEMLVLERGSVAPQDVSEADVEKQLELKKRDYSRPAMRRASHVVVPTKAEAQALIKELKGASRETFARIATEKSQDPSTKNQGGELGYFDHDGLSDRGAPTQASPELAAATFKLRAVGDITSAPIPLADGFSVLMFTGEMKAVETPRRAVDELIREELSKTQGATKYDALMAELRDKYKPVVHTDLIDHIVMPPREPSAIPSGFSAAPPDPREPPKMIAPDAF
jgi:peptidyl-prolyl cis-trans isomerase C